MSERESLEILLFKPCDCAFAVTSPMFSLKLKYLFIAALDAPRVIPANPFNKFAVAANNRK